MSKIQLLDQHTINKIAAGEVVEKPASVVKELVENAIDAKSSAVTVEIKDGGTSYIRITDNGIGIPKESVKTAFLRHSTSKIKDEYDLAEVGTLGFRGEALASIAAVAKVEMMTKTRDDLTGIRFVIEGGKVIVEEEIGCPEGTTIIVRNLFFNTPARRKFLKRPGTEGTYIGDLMNRMALGHPEVSFKYMNKGKVQLHTSGNSDLKSCIFSVYGKSVVKEMIAVNIEGEHVGINGFIGKPVLSRGNRNFESYYINGRYIKSKIIEKGIHDAYKDFIPVGSFPYVVLHIDIEPGTIDVNVHPTKMEVRFEETDHLYKLTKEHLYRFLQQDNLIPNIQLSKEKEKKEPIKSYVPEAFEVENKNLGTKEITQINKTVETKEVQAHIGDEVKNTMVDDNKGIPQEPYTRALNLNHPEISNRSKDSKISTEATMNNAINNRTSRFPELKSDVLGKQPTTHHTTESNEMTSSLQVKDQENANDAVKISQEMPSTYSYRQPIEHEVDMETIKKVVAQEQDLYEPTTFSKPKETEQVDIGLNKLTETLKGFQLVGQVFGTYWIVERDKNMYIVDQHAAHEKVLYEKFLKSKNGDMNTQVLLTPIVINLTEEETLFLSKNIDVFASFGFEIEDFGNNAYIVRGVPFLFNSTVDESFFMTMIDGLISEDKVLSEDLIGEKIALMSCKAAVKGNNKLSYSEMESLMEQLFTLENPFNCPHGRPTIISLTKYELEKKFKRV